MSILMLSAAPDKSRVGSIGLFSTPFLLPENKAFWGPPQDQPIAPLPITSVDDRSMLAPPILRAWPSVWVIIFPSILLTRTELRAWPSVWVSIFPSFCLPVLRVGPSCNPQIYTDPVVVVNSVCCWALLNSVLIGQFSHWIWGGVKGC